MKYYTVRFYKDGKQVSYGSGMAYDKEEAEMKAEFYLACHFPNLEYDRVIVEEHYND